MREGLLRALRLGALRTPPGETSTRASGLKPSTATRASASMAAVRRVRGSVGRDSRRRASSLRRRKAKCLRSSSARTRLSPESRSPIPSTRAARGGRATPPAHARTLPRARLGERQRRRHRRDHPRDGHGRPRHLLVVPDTRAPRLAGHDRRRVLRTAQRGRRRAASLRARGDADRGNGCLREERSSELLRPRARQGRTEISSSSRPRRGRSTGGRTLHHRAVEISPQNYWEIRPPGDALRPPPDGGELHLQQTKYIDYSEPEIWRAVRRLPLLDSGRRLQYRWPASAGWPARTSTIFTDEDPTWVGSVSAGEPSAGTAAAAEAAAAARAAARLRGRTAE